jgi:microcin C transport system substrate-binding protein
MSFRDVENVEKLGKFHVRFNFKNANNRNLPLIIASLPILPKHFYEKNDFSKSSLTIPIGSGPYKIKDFVANRYVAYERNKNYWGASLPINIGRYNFDKIIFDYYRDNNVLIEAFKAQKYDFRQENVARNWANAYNIKAVENGEIIKREIEHEMPAPTQVFILNLRKTQFQNHALRKAITQVFDFEWLRDHIFYGSYKRNESYFTNSEFAFKDFKLPKTAGDGINRQNIIIAQKILAAAGYQIIEQKLIDPITKKPVSIEFMIDQKAFEMVVAPYIKNLKKLGIDAKMRFVEENQFQTRINNFDFDVMVGVYPQNIIPGSELFGYFHSSQKNIKGSRNLAGLDDKYVDDLVEKISSAKTKEQLKYFCKKLDKHLLENYYAILQWHNNKHRVLYRDIFEFPKTLPKYSLAIDSWWIKPQFLNKKNNSK